MAMFVYQRVAPNPSAKITVHPKIESPPKCFFHFSNSRHPEWSQETHDQDSGSVSQLKPHTCLNIILTTNICSNLFEYRHVLLSQTPSLPGKKNSLYRNTNNGTQKCPHPNNAFQFGQDLTNQHLEIWVMILRIPNPVESKPEFLQGSGQSTGAPMVQVPRFRERTWCSNRLYSMKSDTSYCLWQPQLFIYIDL